MQQNQSHMNFWMIIILQDLFWFLCLIQVLWLRFVPRNCIGPKFCPLWTEILESCPPSCVSCHSKRFRREENVSPRGPPPWFTCQRTSANVEGAGKNQSRQSYTCLLTTNCHFPADLGHFPKILLYLGKTVFANLICIQDWAGYFSVRWRGILKLSTHTE